MNRRKFLISGSAAAATGLLAGIALRPGEPSAPLPPTAPRDSRAATGLGDLRASFPLSSDHMHLAALLVTSHPAPVSRSISRYRQELDRNPAMYVDENHRKLQLETVEAAAGYIGGRPQDVALTDSTTMGIALVYNGVLVREDQEFLTTDHDYYSTQASLEFRSRRTGASVRKFPLFPGSESVPANASADEITDRIIRAIARRTRVLALTWVHSSTGLKIPVRQIADRVAEINRKRSHSDRILLCLDGVHGFGVEDVDIPELGCDFFMAGTHKWLFGPRGTGILWGAPDRQSEVGPTIPTFRTDPGWGAEMTPGGFKAFEHLWALKDAFELHQRLGRAEINRRTRELATQLKDGLARIRKVTLHTPRSPGLSAGIVCFGIDGMAPREVVNRLLERNIIASVTPYTTSYARMTPAAFNTPAEIDRALAALSEL